MQANNKVVSGLTLIALVAIVAAYFSPIWWVSLTAPNYPPDAFPDGIRIHFHFDGVYNGCKAARKGSQQAGEIIEKDLGHDDERFNPILDAKKDFNKGAEGLDCVHEMNTINHYVGMFPIATGAPVEKPLAKFFFAFFATMMVAFAQMGAEITRAVEQANACDGVRAIILTGTGRHFCVGADLSAGARSLGSPCPPRRKVRPACVPAGIRNATGPVRVGTRTSPPSKAAKRSTGASQCKSSPRRSNIGCGSTLMIR